MANQNIAVGPNIRVGRISYVNVAPVYYGFDAGLRPEWIKMLSAPPSVLNNMMLKGDLDISPVSSAAYAQHQDKWLILPDLSISCFGKIMSVIIVSRYPFYQLNNKKVIFTDESETAAELLKLLFMSKQIAPFFETRTIKNPKDIQKDDGAVLLIGDTALKEKWSTHYDYVWDLGDMWKKLTGLPFVFAIWVVKKSFADKRPETVSSIIDLFHSSKKKGGQNIDRIAKTAAAKLGISVDTCSEYFDKLCYDLNSFQIDGIEAFFKRLYKEKIVSKPVKLSFFDFRR